MQGVALALSLRTPAGKVPPACQQDGTRRLGGATAHVAGWLPWLPGRRAAQGRTHLALVHAHAHVHVHVHVHVACTCQVLPGGRLQLYVHAGDGVA